LGGKTSPPLSIDVQSGRRFLISNDRRLEISHPENEIFKMYGALGYAIASSMNASQQDEPSGPYMTLRWDGIALAEDLVVVLPDPSAIEQLRSQTKGL
jgi:hypothetical protein